MSRVIATRLCPSIVCTVLGDSPNTSIRVAKVCRASWNRIGVTLLALSASGRSWATFPGPSDCHRVGRRQGYDPDRPAPDGAFLAPAALYAGAALPGMPQ